MNPTFAHGNIVYIILKSDPVTVETSRIGAAEFLLRFLFMPY